MIAKNNNRTQKPCAYLRACQDILILRYLESKRYPQYAILIEEFE